MEKVYTVPQLQAILSPVFSRYGIRRAVLFGSYGKGTATEKSDVDLLVDSGLRGLKLWDSWMKCSEPWEKKWICSTAPIFRPGQESTGKFKARG